MVDPSVAPVVTSLPIIQILLTLLACVSLGCYIAERAKLLQKRRRRTLRPAPILLPKTLPLNS